MLKHFILTEIKLILMSLFLTLGSLFYLNLEFQKLENYKGLSEILVKPYMYDVQGLFIILWYISVLICIYFIIKEVFNFIKDKIELAKYEKALQPKTVKEVSFVFDTNLEEKLVANL